jgi:hypothetical protein
MPAPGYQVSIEHHTGRIAYDGNVVRGEYTLKTTAERTVIVLSATGIGIVSQSLVPMTSDGV